MCFQYACQSNCGHGQLEYLLAFYSKGKAATLLYLSKFLKGLELFGVAANVVQHPNIFKEAFVNTSEGNMDANYVVSPLNPVYSPEGALLSQNSFCNLSPGADLGLVK